MNRRAVRRMSGAGNWYLMSISDGNYLLFQCKTKAWEERRSELWKIHEFAELILEEHIENQGEGKKREAGRGSRSSFLTSTEIW